MSLELDLRLDPYPMYAEMRKAPVTFSPEFGAWLLYRYDEIRQVLSDPQTFSSNFFEGLNSELIVDSLTLMDPPRHTKLRALATYAFTPKAIAELQPRIREIAHEQLDAALQKGDLDFVKEFAVPFPVRVIAEMLGVPAQDRSRFEQWSDTIVAATERLALGIAEELPEHVAAYREMRAYFHRLMQERRERPQADIISRLAAAEIDGQRLTEEEAADFCILLMAAGNETTTNLLANGMRSFAENPAQWELLCRDASLLPQAVEEIFRFRSPAPVLFRVARAEAEVGGQLIKAGERVALFLVSANRDESKFPDGDRFDITRPITGHLALGHGIHFCLGAPLARMEARIALEALVERVAAFRIPDGARLEPLANFMVSGLRSLPLEVTLHSN